MTTNTNANTSDTVPLPSLPPTREEDPTTVELDEIITSTLASQIVLGTADAVRALAILEHYVSAQVEPAE